MVSRVIFSLNLTFLICLDLTSSRSAEDGVMPASSFQTRGARGNARGFLVRIATPKRMPVDEGEDGQCSVTGVPEG